METAVNRRGGAEPNRQTWSWNFIAVFVAFHIAAGWALVTIRFSLLMWIYVWFYGNLAGLGITGGAHRLWTHRSFKAKLPLRIIFMLAYSATGNIPLLRWVRDHRVHHKCVDTDADPHNSRRGLFYSHMGWATMRRHADVLREGAKIDYSDLLADPVIRFNLKYHWHLFLIFGVLIPTAIPVYAWSETWLVSYFANIVRLVLFLHIEASVNSVAHAYGSKPYDREIFSTDNALVSFFAAGEGWHNYHHTFPWDYKTAELPYFLNLTTAVIDGFAKIGWAYDLKSPTKDLVNSVAMKRGDGSRSTSGVAHQDTHGEKNKAQTLLDRTFWKAGA